MNKRLHSFKQRIIEIWSDPKERRVLKWISTVLWGLVLLGFVFTFIFFFILAHSDLPGFKELENPEYDLASVIYDREGIPFGKYYIENREIVEFDEISPLILDALLSVEDTRFFRHSGIDFRALIRVAVKSILLGKASSGGGSTLSQQLAKLLFKRSSLSGKSKTSRMIALATIKFKEWITAVRLEKSYTKEEIISMYLSKFEFINGAHGIQSAAKIYFNEDQKDLKKEEAATLIGMLKNPARFNPIRFTDRTKSRRDIVLRMMSNSRKISRQERDSLIQLPIDISRFKRSTQSEGLAPYFRSELTKWLKPLLLKKEYHRPKGGAYDIYRDGLKIYTTIDSRYQVHAERAVEEHMAILQDRYWKVWKWKNPLTFEAEEEQVELRNESINRRIRDSDIYKNGFLKYFGELNKETQSEFDLFLKEPTLRRLLSNLEYLENIEPTVREKYKSLIQSDKWPKVKDSWKKFMYLIQEKFNEELNAKLFAYNSEHLEYKEMTRRDSVLHMMRFLQTGLLSVDPKTGDILAWVGGVNHNYFKYDHVTMRRQVGSTIKPFVYATAIGVQGISPCQEYSDIQYTIAPGEADFNVDSEWSPSNANGLFTENKYNLYQGLLYSKNSISVRILKEMGTVEHVRDLLNSVGIGKYERLGTGRLLVPKVPSICLGSVDLSLLEMVGGYTTFANNGIYTQPIFIDRIEDKNGKLIYKSSSLKRRALNPLFNSVMVDMLRNNTGGGFGMGLKSDNGGKTGTTNDFADGWFIGITPKLVTGIWVGGDEKWVRFYTLDDGQGFIMARPIYQKYMKALEEDEKIDFDVNARFTSPPPGFRDLVDCSRYKQGKPEEELEQSVKQRIDLDEFDENEFNEFDHSDSSQYLIQIKNFNQ